MKFHGITLEQGSTVANLTVHSGTSFPTNPDEGELFFRSDVDIRIKGLYLYVGGTWDRIASTDSLTIPNGATLPSLANEGDIFYLNTDDSSEGIYVYKNAAWVNTTAGAAPTFTVTGDVSGTLDGGVDVLTLANTAVTPGAFGSGAQTLTLTVDAKGRITDISAITSTPAWASITGKPTTLAGYGITDAQPLDTDLTAIAALAAAGLVTKTGDGTAATRILEASGNGLTITNANGVAGNPTVVSNAVSTNTASTLVFRDASGDFSAGTITANLTGASSLNVLKAGDTMTGPLIVGVNSSNDAVRITQTGTGNALVVEDSTNPDATPFVVRTDGRVVIWHNASQTLSSAAVPTLQAVGSVASFYHGADEFGSGFILAKSRGAVGAQGAVVAEDAIGTFGFEASDGTSYIRTAQVRAAVDGSVSTGQVPSRIGFFTTPVGSGTQLERLRIASSGAIGLGGANYGTAGQVLTSAGSDAPATWTTPATVSSVAVSGSTGLTVSGSPITSSGTISLTLDTGLQNLATLATTGLVVASATDTWVSRSIAVSGNGLTVSNATGIAGNPTVTSNATSANTASTIVFRDASGDFSAGTITAALSGNATSATSLQTARDFSLTGDVTASAVSFNGSGNVALSTTLGNTTVTAGSYGSATSVATFTVNSQGRLTAASNTAITFPVTSVAGKTGAVTLTTADISGYGTVSDAVFTLQDDVDSTKQARFQLSGITTGTTRTYTLPNVDATLAVTANTAQTFAGSTTFSNAAVTVGSSTATATYGLGTGATLSGSTKTVNIGTSGVAGSTTTINVGSSTSDTTINFAGEVLLSADPTVALGAATKQYVDSVAQGMQAKPAVEIATTANLTATYSNGTGGVGATLTATTNGAFPAIDGVTLTSTTLGENGVLVKNQTNAAHNGRYNLTQVGDAGTPWILTRCGLCDEADEIPGAYVFVKRGTLYTGTGWVQTVANPTTFVVGTDAITVTQFSGAGAYTAGAGLTSSGTTFNVGTASTARIVVNADNIDLATVGTAGTYNSVTTDSYGRVTSGTNNISGTGTTYVTNTSPTITNAVLAGTTNFTSGAPVRAWTSADTDIDGLISGTAAGIIFESPASQHFTIGIRSNDTGDGFQVISKGAATTPATDPYNTLAFEVKANGNTTVAGTLTVDGTARFTDNARVESTTSPIFFLNSPTVQGAYFSMRVNGLNRWVMGSSSAAETGSNAGSNFFIQRQDDAGAVIDIPFSITRSTGQITIGSGGLTTTGAVSTGALTAATVTTTSSVTVNQGTLSTTSTTVSTTAATTIDSVSATTVRSAKYLVQVHDTTNSHFHMVEILAIHNGTTVWETEYGEVVSNAPLGTFDTDISGGNLRLVFTATAATTKNIKVLRTAILA